MEEYKDRQRRGDMSGGVGSVGVSLWGGRLMTSTVFEVEG